MLNRVFGQGNLPFFLLVLSISAAGCAISERGEPGAPPSPQPPPLELARQPTEGSYSIVPVLYATDRELERVDTRRAFYNDERGPLRYGMAEVSVPSYRVRAKGEFNRPAWYRFEFYEDPEQHFVILSAHEYADLAAFQEDLSSLAQESDDAALVYLHGFNVPFDEALMRTAQLAWDMDFPGAPVAYIWPSRGRFGPIAYNQDQNYADATVPAFREFLSQLRVSGVEKIHVIAHSMGNRVLLNALKGMPAEDTRLGQVIMAAPDVRTPIFVEQLHPQVIGKAERFTVYASEKDLAMAASRTFNDFKALGDTRNGITVVEGFEMIDASDIDTSIIGHDYVASERALISDIFDVLKNNMPPEKRDLRARATKDGRYWEIIQ